MKLSKMISTGINYDTQEVELKKTYNKGLSLYKGKEWNLAIDTFRLLKNKTGKDSNYQNTIDSIRLQTKVKNNYHKRSQRYIDKSNFDEYNQGGVADGFLGYEGAKTMPLGYCGGTLLSNTVGFVHYARLSSGSFNRPKEESDSSNVPKPTTPITYTGHKIEPIFEFHGGLTYKIVRPVWLYAAVGLYT
jgi:hypothetical protein